ncbi:MAG TPA: hypothetical protein VFE53_11875 [Mucilaginibacter sp.]|jgi:ABC-type dipeptide/oligopeptide/nickel transport system ATPase component|nr:hypothetical protein [Mucilaginibacter sp.]
MKIIALIGPSGCGKTTTLSIVYNRLLANGGVSNNRQQLGANPNDFSDIVNWQGKQVAFFSMGDYSGYLVNATRYYRGLNIDTFVCACNDRFARPIYEFQNPVYNYIPIFKVREPNPALRAIADNNAAQTIYNLI